MKKIKPAATILLARDNEGEVEVLLLKRNKALAFAGGLWVFPGGKIDTDELENSKTELEAAHIAAVRETKEEADLDINIDDLIFYRHWTTPEIEPRRYATYFFFSEAKMEQSNVQIDDSEIKDHLWISPKKAIEKMRAGKLAMLPPTLMSLQLIQNCKTVEEVKSLLKDEEPIFILPVLIPDNGKMICIYEGDAAYSTGDPNSKGARHRLVLDMAKGDFEFEFKDCEGFRPINGGMHLQKKSNQIIEPIRIELSLGIMFPSVNCYLIPGEQLTLIDCGLDSEENWKTLQQKIKEHGFQISDIQQVIISHEHRDHIGLLPQILKNTNAIIRAPKMIEGWFSQPEKMKADYFRFIKKLFRSLGFPKEVLEQSFQFVEAMRSYPKIKELDRFQFFEEGEILTFGNTEWEALNTPGHCPSQFVFLQKEQKRLVSSDMLLPIAPMPIVSQNLKNPEEPLRALNELLSSFDRLKKYNIQKVYPGHGPEFSDANAIIEKQLTRIEMRKQECFEAIQSGLTTPYQINRKMYPYQMMPPDFSGMYMVLGYLDLLEEEGKIKKDINADGTLQFSSI